MPLVARDGSHRAVLGRDGVVALFVNGTQARTIVRMHKTPPHAIRLDGDRLAVVTAATHSSDRPARAEIYGTETGGLVAQWPLLGTPSTLDLHDDVLLYSARNSGGLFGLRLTDGKTTLFGPVQAHDAPQINEYGIVFQSNLYKRLDRGRAVVKFLPMPVVRRAFERTFDRLDVRYRITAFAMDGPRVSVVLDVPGRDCDAVHFWNVPWHSFVRINMRRDVTCTEGLAIGDSLAMAGIAVQWIATKARTSQVIVSDGDKCIEHKAGVLRTPTPPLAGDGLHLAFGGLRSGASSGVELMNWKTHTHVALRSTTRARALSVDQNRVALLGQHGQTHLFTADGKLVTRLLTGAPRAIALRGNQLVTLTERMLQVWSVEQRRQVGSWQLPSNTRSEVDVHHGIAVFVADRSVYALDLRSGRRVALARTPTRPRAQIETAGVAYQFNADSRGALTFIPLATVERLLGIR